MSSLTTAASAVAARIADAEQRLSARESNAAPAARRASLGRAPAPGDSLALARVAAARRHLQDLLDLRRRLGMASVEGR